jgi:type VI secretion system secreted protein VgrG
VLAGCAQQHGARGTTAGTAAQLVAEPDVAGAQGSAQASAQEGRGLMNEQALDGLRESLQATDSRGGGGAGDGGDGDGGGQSDDRIGGGTGTVAAWGRPDLVLAGPAAVSAWTPGHMVLAAGRTASLVAGQGIARVAQRHVATLAAGDVTLFTHGRATNANKPVQATGIALHAASGSVHVAALQSRLEATAAQALNVASTAAAVRASAPQRIVLTAGGSAIELTGGRITLKSPGPVAYRSTMQDLTGPRGAEGGVKLAKAGRLPGCAKALQDAAVIGGAV